MRPLWLDTTRCPPGRSTRANSRNGPSMSAKCTSAIAQTTRSTESSSSGSWWRSASWNSPSGTFSRARASIPGDESTPITVCPSDARYAACRPVPHAASSATPMGSPSRISRTIGCSISRSWFGCSSYEGAQRVIALARGDRTRLDPGAEHVR